MKNVSVAEFVRNFAQYREVTKGEPVVLTNHGRETHVLMSMAEFERLNQVDGQLVSDSDALELLRTFSGWISETLYIVDDQMIIRSVNQRAEQINQKCASKLVGTHFLDLHPKMRDSVVATAIQRAISTGEPTEVEFASLIREQSWARMRCFPWGDHYVVLMKNITDEKSAYRFTELTHAISDVFDAHGNTAFALLSQRGTIDTCSDFLAEKVGLPRRRLVGVPFADLLELKARAEFRERLDLCLRNETGEHLRANLLVEGSQTQEVVIGLSGIHRSYGVDGALLLMTFE